MMSQIESRRLMEAAAWRTHLAEAGMDWSEELQAWLAEDLQNATAWRQVQAPWELLGEQATAPELIRLRRAALAHAHDTGRSRSNRPRRFTVRVITGTAGLILAVAALFVWQNPGVDVYRTRAGERRVVTLSDGSQVALDSQSDVRVRYTAHTRELTLARGQARFDVAHDLLRPFSVTADGHRVIATGTAFNVDLLGSDLFVTLIEGRVVVLPTPPEVSVPPPQDLVPPAGTSSGHSAAPDQGPLSVSDASLIVLNAGEQLLISRTSPLRIAPINVDRAIAWENGQLVFENEPLASVIVRVNRYASHPIVVGDEAISGLRISGVFHTGDVDGFVSTIVSYLPVSAQPAAGGSIRLTSR